ncbi:hypothetical protein STPH2_2060 [Streptomyces sp. KO7888]|nr:hypothetical protein [Streptomyces sp. KO7888]
MAVDAELALQREQPGDRRGEAGQDRRELGQRLPYTPSFVAPMRPAPPTSGTNWARSAGRQGVRNDCGMRDRSRASGAHVGQPPDPAAVLAHENQQHGTGAPVMTRMPPTAPFPALAGPEMGSEDVTAGMDGQMSNNRRPRGGRLQGLDRWRTQRADKYRSTRLGPQFDRPDAPHCRVCCAKPHRARAPPTHPRRCRPHAGGRKRLTAAR